MNIGPEIELCLHTLIWVIRSCSVATTSLQNIYFFNYTLVNIPLSSSIHICCHCAELLMYSTIHSLLVRHWYSVYCLLW
ncbi:hypothetical protein C0J52_26882 [Blattella germanica]|nr:hypothetical protein C0J52_26882 [Blattella germanica]